MSWWDTKHFASFASQALKTAQKKIDKVLDIKEDGDDESNKKEDDSFVNKWLSAEKLMSSSTSVIEGSSSFKDNLWSEFVNEGTISGSEYENATSQKQNLWDVSPPTEKNIVSLKAKHKTSNIGSSKSAFKKFKDFKEQLLEDGKLHADDKSSDIFHEKEISLSPTKANDEYLPNQNEVVFVEDCFGISNVNPLMSKSSINFEEIDSRLEDNHQSNILTEGEDELDLKLQTIHSMEEQNITENDKNVHHNSTSFNNFSKVWSDSTSSQKAVRLGGFHATEESGDDVLIEVDEVVDVAIGVEENITQEDVIGSTCEDVLDGVNWTIYGVVDEASNNSTEIPVDSTSVSDEQVESLASETNETKEEKEDDDEFTPVKDDEVSPVKGDEVSPVKDDEVFPVIGDEVFPVIGDEVSPVIDESLTCFADSTSSVTLITESSLENSTCASDDLSESNKTLTGEEGNFLLTNFSNLCDSQLDPIMMKGNSLNFMKIGEMEEETSGSSADVSQSPDIVQGMIEEAMNEEGLKDDKHEDTVSPREETRQDKLSLEANLPAESGQTSGHTSADEVDTTTSSDIEIISHMSTPSFLGGSWRPPTCDKHRVVSSGATDLSSPSKRTTARTGSPSGVIGHRRSDSGSSGQSLQSRNGEDFVSIDYANTKGGFVDVRHRKCIPLDITHQLTSLTNENESMLKKILDLEEILEAREKKVLELSQDNLDLMETSTILRNQLLHEEGVNEAEKEDLKSLSDEFTRRISDYERRFQVATKEKEALKRALVEADNEKKSTNASVEKFIREKDQIIAELMEEGEKLSKQQLQVSTAVKKLRMKDKENESTIKLLRDKNSEQKFEIERLETILESKVEAEKKYVENINQINSALKSSEDEIVRLKNDLEDSQEKSRSFKYALDNSYKEMSELHRARMTDITEAQRAAASVEMTVKDELLKNFEKLKVKSKQVEDQLVMQIEDLQLSMSRMEKENGRREDALRQEISDLQQRLQEAEERNHELTHSVSTATRPLLRQIENIQSTFAIQSNNFERIERNLSDRLVEAQNQLVSSVEKERTTNENLMELSARVNSLDLQISSFRQDKARLQAELEMERSKLGALEETKHIITAQKDRLIANLEDEVKELKREKILLGNQVEMEKMKADVERKKNVVVSDQLKEKDMQLQNWSLKSTPTPQPSDDVLKMSTNSSTPTNDDYQERSTSRYLYGEGGGRHSVYESIRGASGSTIIENLQSQLKLKQGEISQLLSNISDLERTRESLSQELVKVTILSEELHDKLELHSEMEKNLYEVTDRHNALLQMYGEKVEEAEELRMDLQDIKDIYKCQMDELLKLKSKHIPS